MLTLTFIRFVAHFFFGAYFLLLSFHCHFEITVIYEYKAAFPEVYKFFCGVQLFGACTATCENFFSCLQRVLRKQRMSMNHRGNTGSSLVHVAYESDITNNIKLDDFVEVFKNKHPRRLNLQSALHPTGSAAL